MRSFSDVEVSRIFAAISLYCDTIFVVVAADSMSILLSFSCASLACSIWLFNAKNTPARADKTPRTIPKGFAFKAAEKACVDTVACLTLASNSPITLVSNVVSIVVPLMSAFCAATWMEWVFITAIYATHKPVTHFKVFPTDCQLSSMYFAESTSHFNPPFLDSPIEFIMMSKESRRFIILPCRVSA